MRAIVALCLTLAACSGPPQDDPEFQRQLSILLKDPASVQYQAVTSSPAVVCGELNAKNSYGAYAGFKVFVFDRKEQELYLEDSDEDAADHKRFLETMRQCSNHLDLFSNLVSRSANETRAMLGR